MASKVKKDPLSRYFKDLDEFEVSSGEEDSESDEQSQPKSEPASTPSSVSTAEKEDNCESHQPEKKSVAFGAKSKETPTAKKLPSAHECLKTQSSPAFLRLGQQKEVDWDKNLKSLDHPENDGPIDFKTNAVPPPTSYEPVTDPGIKVVDDEGNKRKRVEDELEDQMTTTKAYKVHKDNDEDK